MARFMILTFLILGWGFYEMSGGSDFTPPEIETRPLAALAQETRALTSQPDVEDEPAPEIIARADTAPRAVATPQRPASPQRAVITQASFATPVAEAPQAVIEALPREIRAPEEALIEEAAVESVVDLDIRAVAGSRVNMRTGPGTSFAVLDTLTEGVEAEVLEENGAGWVKIRVADNGAEGWMAARLMRSVN